jgi:hypothetical protein
MLKVDDGLRLDESVLNSGYFPPAKEDHLAGFIHAVRTRNQKDVRCSVLDGHISTSVCHMGNIETGTQLVFVAHLANTSVVSQADGSLFNVCHWLCQCMNPALAKPVALKNERSIRSLNCETLH